MDIESIWVASTIVVWVLAILAIYELSEPKASGHRTHLNWKRLLGGLFLAFHIIGFYAFYTFQ